MGGELVGRTTVVTGAGKGIGAGIALEFAEAGANVGLVDLDSAALDEVRKAIVKKGGRAVSAICDVANRAQFHDACGRFRDELGEIDALVNNAMWTKYEPLDAISEEDLERSLAIGVKAVIWGAQALCKFASPSRGATLVNLTSATAFLGFRNAASYSAAKGAIAALTRQLAVELGPRHIRVNAIAPGPIPTAGARTVVDEEGWRRREARTPLGVLGGPADIGRAAVFLISDAGKFVTGQILTVDGGFTIAGP